MRTPAATVLPSPLDQMRQDLRLAFRRLRLAPGFTLFAIVSLALGIGVSTAVYSAVRTLFWMPLGVPDLDRIVAVTGARVLPSMSWLDFDDLQRQQATFRAITATSPLRTALASPEGAEVVFGEAVSGGYFAVMSVAPRLGRLLSPSDERDAVAAVVISENLWRRHFHGDAAVVGRSIRLGGRPYEIVGVSRGAFHGLQRFESSSVWIPITAATAGGLPIAAAATDRQRPACFVYGRLKPDVTMARALNETSVIGQRLDAAYPRGDHRRRDWGLRADLMHGPDAEAVNTVGGMILTSVAILLLIACSNLANLALAKGTSRTQETAVRTALGASRSRLIRQQLVEACVIVLAGGGIGVAVLYALVDYLTTDLPVGFGNAIAFRPEISVAVLAASAASMILAVVVFGLWPAIQGTRTDVRTQMGSGPSATPRWRLHRNLVAWQVCGCVALVLVAAMMQRIIGAVGRNLPVIRAANLSIAQVDFELNARDEAQMRRTVDAVLASLRAQSGVQRVVASNALPVGFASMPAGLMVTTPEVPFSQSRDVGRGAGLIATTPGLFEAIGTRLIRGRGFDARDDAAAPRVTIISERFARALFQSTDVVGRTIVVSQTARLSSRSPEPKTMTIVGVSSDLDASARRFREEFHVFVPWPQWYERRAPVFFTVSSASPGATVPVLRSTIRAVDPDLAITMAGTGAVILQGPLFLLHLISTFATTLATLSLVLAMAGLFGVLSHVVLRRTREIGIRLALGASRPRIFRLILRDGFRPVAKGIVLGLTIGIGARMAVRSWVVTDISAVEPLAVLLVPIPFVVAAFVACYLPAARASRVDPNVALRQL